jgi:urea transport system ATP-binding protein
MAIVVVEQYLDFAREIADHFVVMERGEVVLAGANDDLREDDMRRYLTV